MRKSAFQCTRLRVDHARVSEFTHRCHYVAVNWPALARAVVAQRTALGYTSQKTFAAASDISLRTVSDLETGKRDSYSASTLGRLQTALQWPEGHIAAILASTDDNPAAPPVSELSTIAGIMRHIHRDDFVLAAMLHRSGLSEVDLFKLLLKIRVRRERQNADLLAEVAAAVVEAGGWAPEQPWPPTWLTDEGGRTARLG